MITSICRKNFPLHRNPPAFRARPHQNAPPQSPIPKADQPAAPRHLIEKIGSSSLTMHCMSITSDCLVTNPHPAGVFILARRPSGRTLKRDHGLNSTQTSKEWPAVVSSSVGMVKATIAVHQCKVACTIVLGLGLAY